MGTDPRKCATCFIVMVESALARPVVVTCCDLVTTGLAISCSSDAGYDIALARPLHCLSRLLTQRLCLHAQFGTGAAQPRG